MQPQLKLENQLCFPLYAVSKAVTRLYLPYLTPLGITYTQYVVFLVLFEHDGIRVKELGKQLFLDSGTLSPLLEKLEKQGYIQKENSGDKRERIVVLTQKGKDMEAKLAPIPQQIAASLNLNQEEAQSLYSLCYKLIDHLEENHE